MERKSILEKMNLPLTQLIINKKPVIGLVGVPKKTVYFILFVQTKAFIENNNTKTSKLSSKNEIVALSMFIAFRSNFE